MAERVVDSLEVVEVDKEHRCTGRAAREGRLNALEEERPVGKAREQIVVGLVAEALLQIVHLRQRTLEPPVLEHHARMADERLEQPPVIRVERLDVARAVADDEQSEGAALAPERGDDSVRKRTRGEVVVELMRRAGRR